MQFDNAMTVDHWSFNKLNSSFTAPASGYYWLHITTAIPGGMMTDVRMVGANRSVGIVRNHTSFTGGAVTASADTVIYLTSGTNIHVSSSYTLYSDTMLQTSFGGFLLDSIMSTVVAFAAGLSKTFSTISSNVPFDIIYEDTNRAWNTTTSEYVVPVAGVYALSTLTTAAGSSRASLQLRVNGQVIMLHSFMGDTVHTNTDTVSGFTLLSLSMGDRVSENVWYGPILSPTTFSAMLYSPTLLPAVAFAVTRNISAVVNAPADPVQYNWVFVNVGNGWNADTYRFTAPLAGVYYLHFVTLVQAHTRGQLDLLVNGNATINLIYMTTSHNFYDQRSRGFLMRMRAADEVRVRLTNGSFYTNINCHETLSGFLLHL